MAAAAIPYILLATSIAGTAYGAYMQNKASGAQEKQLKAQSRIASLENARKRWQQIKEARIKSAQIQAAGVAAGAAQSSSVQTGQTATNATAAGNIGHIGVIGGLSQYGFNQGALAARYEGQGALGTAIAGSVMSFASLKQGGFFNQQPAAKASTSSFGSIRPGGYYPRMT